MTSAAFSPDGRRVVTASSNGTVWVSEVFVDTRELMTNAKAIAPFCLSPAQRETFFLPRNPPAWCIEMAKPPYNTAAWKTWLAETRAGRNPPLPAAP